MCFSNNTIRPPLTNFACFGSANKISHMLIPLHPMPSSRLVSPFTKHNGFEENKLRLKKIDACININKMKICI